MSESQREREKEAQAGEQKTSCLVHSVPNVRQLFVLLTLLCG